MIDTSAVSRGESSVRGGAFSFLYLFFFFFGGGGGGRGVEVLPGCRDWGAGLGVEGFEGLEVGLRFRGQGLVL